MLYLYSVRIYLCKREGVMVSRKHFFVLSFFLLTVFIISIFLLLEVSTLKRNYDLLVLEKQSQSLEVRQLTRGVDVLKKDLNGFGDDLGELASYVTEVSTQLPDELRSEFKKTFLANPNLTVPTHGFTRDKQVDGTIHVTGYRKQILDWMRQNEFFLDHIVRKSLVLEWDGARNQVIVADVIDDSVFEQIGIQKGDLILNVDGRALSRGDDIRSALMELRPKKITLERNRQKLTLDVKFEEAQPQEQVAADFVN